MVKTKGTLMDYFDLVVVGAGPAGASAAREAVKAGLKTLLLEKESIPREKRCGGGISNATLNALDFPLSRKVIERECYGMWGIQSLPSRLSGILTEVRVNHCVATMVTRATFDAFLVEKAKEVGVLVRDNEACINVRVNTGCVYVETNKATYASPVIIGADGVYSTVSKMVRPPWTKRELRFCLVADVPLLKETIDKKMRNLVELRYGYIKQGYAWAFPKKTHISFGIGGIAAHSKTLKTSFTEYLKLHNVDENIRFKGCFIPITEFKHDIVADRIMLCGDAAGFVDCFNGEGIHYAVESGRMAGRSAARAFAKKDFSKASLMEYQREFYDKNKRDMVWSSRITRLSSRFPHLVFRPLLADRKTILRYFDVMSGRCHFRDFAFWVILRLPFLIVRHFLFKGKKDKSGKQ
jgi:geranylgeranyl reductase family protein